MIVPDHTLLALLRTGATRADLRYVLANAMAALDERGLNPMLHDDVSSSDDFLAALTSLLADATSTADALLPFQWASLRNEDLTTQEAWFAVSAGVFADGVSSSDALGAIWLFPAWSDSVIASDAVTVLLAPMYLDDVTTSELWLASMSVGAADSFSASESIAGWVQDYSIAPDYFAGDYATFQFL